MTGGSILTILLLFIVIVSAEVEQFCSGINKVSGLWDLIMKDPLPWEDAFCKRRSVSKKFFIEEMEIQYSPDGSNRRKEENETVYSWEIFLQDIEGKSH